MDLGLEGGELQGRAGTWAMAPAASSPASARSCLHPSRRGHGPHLSLSASGLSAAAATGYKQQQQNCGWRIGGERQRAWVGRERTPPLPKKPLRSSGSKAQLSDRKTPQRLTRGVDYVGHQGPNLRPVVPPPPPRTRLPSSLPWDSGVPLVPSTTPLTRAACQRTRRNPWVSPMGHLLLPLCLGAPSHLSHPLASTVVSSPGCQEEPRVRKRM